MSTRPVRFALALLALSVPVVGGCDAPAPEPAPVAAAPKVDPLAEATAKKKAEREAEEKAAKEAEEQRLAAIDKVAVVPEGVAKPKNLEKACAAVAVANDEFMLKNFEGEALEKWKSAKVTQMGFMKTNCVKAGSIEVAMCQANAMKMAPPELKKDLPDLLTACMTKYRPEGGGAEDGAAPPQ